MTSSTARLLAAMAALSTVAVACGPRIPTDVAVAANSQVLEEEIVTSEAPSTDGGATDGTNPGSVGGTGGTTTGGTSTGGPGPVTQPTSRPNDPESTETQGGGGNESIGTPGETGPIVIGSVGNYSGPAGPPQAPMAQAAQIWAQYRNDNFGGLFGRPIKMIIVDDKGDPAQHLAAVKDLVENKGVVAFVANAAALTSDSSRDYLESKQVPVIGGECAQPWYNTTPWYFNPCPDVEMQFLGGFRNAAMFGTKLAHLYCRETSICSNSNDKLHKYKDEAGIEVVYEAQVTLVQPDFTTECRNAKQAGAEVLYVIVDPTGVERVAQSCARQEYFPTFSQGSATVFYTTKDVISNLVVELPTFPFIGTHTPARNEFQQVMAAYLGKPPGPAETMGWTAAKLFERGATEAARLHQSLTSATLMAGLRTLENETLDGLSVPVSYTERGSEADPCWFGALAQDGEWTVLNDGEPICR